MTEHSGTEHSGTEHSEHELVERLGALGRHPVPPAIQSAHLTAMAASAGGLENRKWFARVRVAGALVLGFLAGSTGLAAAGVDAGVATAPGEAIAKAAGVEIDTDAGTVTHGTVRYYGPECQQLVPEGAKNRGQFLKAVREAGGDVEAAKDTKCGMPLSAEEAEDEAAEAKAKEAKEAKAERDAAKAEKARAKEAGERGDSEADENGDDRSEHRSDVADCAAEGPDPDVAGGAAAVTDDDEPKSTCAPDGPDAAGASDDAGDGDDSNGRANGAEKKAEAEDRADDGQDNRPVGS